MKQDFMEFLGEKIICSASMSSPPLHFMLRISRSCFVSPLEQYKRAQQHCLTLAVSYVHQSSCHVSNKVMSKCTLFVTTHPSPGPKKFEGKILFDLTVSVRTQSVLCYIT